jgi:hypothetical protein
MLEVHPIPKRRSFKNLIGLKSGRLTVISFAGYKKSTSKSIQRNSFWNVSCECGNTKTLLGSNIQHGFVKSCGCLVRDHLWEPFYKHRMTNSPEHRSWSSMIQRCLNKGSKMYRYYGGRGIKVCKRWLGENGFVNFFADMGIRPSQKHSIDRIDNNGHYEPTNCRWVTAKQQNRNKRTNINLTFNGITLPMSEWAEKLGVTRQSIHWRLTHGWPIEKALSLPHKKGVSLDDR